MKKNELKTTAKISLAVALLLGLGSVAQADSYNTATVSTGWQGLSFTYTLYLAQFDTSLGTLTGVTLHITDTEEAGVTVENGSADSASITIELSGLVEATDGDQIDSTANLSTDFGPYSLGPNGQESGLPTYNQSGEDFQDLGTVSSEATKTASSSDFALYEGAGTVPIDVSGSGGWNASGSSAYSLIINEFQGEGSVYATYTYTPAPVPEPATMAMFGLGLGGLAMIRRRSV